MYDIASFTSAILQWLTAFVVRIATAIVEFIRRYVPAAAGQQQQQQSQEKVAAAPLRLPPPHPNSPSSAPTKDKNRDLELKLAHRRGAMAEYTRPKYEVREW
jgi:hypothetical protein